MAKYTRVFQMGFDIAETEETTGEDRGRLFEEIEGLINTFITNKGFISVGCENVEDMSHAYGPRMLEQINEFHDK